MRRAAAARKKLLQMLRSHVLTRAPTRSAPACARRLRLRRQVRAAVSGEMERRAQDGAGALSAPPPLACGRTAARGCVTNHSLNTRAFLKQARVTGATCAPAVCGSICATSCNLQHLKLDSGTAQQRANAACHHAGSLPRRPAAGTRACRRDESVKDAHQPCTAAALPTLQAHTCATPRCPAARSALLLRSGSAQRMNICSTQRSANRRSSALRYCAGHTEYSTSTSCRFCGGAYKHTQRQRTGTHDDCAHAQRCCASLLALLRACAPGRGRAGR
jgi:hypothetical protein